MKEKLLCLCTCTALELITAIGVTGYLIYLGKPILALISGIVFAKLIVFHFIMDYYDKRTTGSKRKNNRHKITHWIYNPSIRAKKNNSQNSNFKGILRQE